MKDNYERLVEMAIEVFDAKHDPEQLDVDEQVIERLKEIHPASISEYPTDSGPAAWLLVIPTTLGVMQKFLSKEISEKELLYKTVPGDTFEALYLCSALVLEEFRQKGIAKKLALEAVARIRTNHPIKALYVWAFTNEGAAAAQSIARSVELPLYQRPE